jgi:hypothetical protein
MNIWHDMDDIVAGTWSIAPGCDGKAQCCAGDVQEVAFDGTRTRNARPGPARSASRLT